LRVNPRKDTGKSERTTHRVLGGSVRKALVEYFGDPRSQLGMSRGLDFPKDYASFS